MPDVWETLVPEAKKSIEKNNNKGDFLAIIGRNHPDERKMSDLIHKWATLDGLKTQEFNLKRFQDISTPDFMNFSTLNFLTINLSTMNFSTMNWKGKWMLVWFNFLFLVFSFMANEWQSKLNEYPDSGFQNALSSE